MTDCKGGCCYVQLAKRRWFSNDLASAQHDYVSDLLCISYGLLSVKHNFTSFLKITREV